MSTTKIPEPAAIPDDVKVTKVSRKYTLSRNYTLRSTMGHTIVFKTGVETWVPREIELDAVAIGAVPVDGEAPPVTDEEQNPAKNTGPEDPNTRKNEIKAAMRSVMDANQRNDFAASGAPKVPALARVLGFDVDAHERDVIWAELKTELSGEDA